MAEVHNTNSKWRESLKRDSGWNTTRKRKVQEIEAKIIIRWLLELNLDKYNILEIGCGNGYLGKILVEYFLDNGIDFNYSFTDLLGESIEISKQTLGVLVKDHRVTLNTLDVYEMENQLGEYKPSIIVSTGYVSAATYRRAIPIVGSILDKNGILVCDFVNHLSLFVFLSNIRSWLSQLTKYFSNIDDKPYHFGSFGIKSYFGLYGLTLIQKKKIRIRRNPILCMFRKQQG